MAHQCDTVLADGAFKRTDLNDSYYTQLVIAARYSRKTYKEARQRTDAGLDIGYEEFKLNGNYSEEDFEKWREDVQSSLDVEQILSHESSVLLSSGDPEILKAWSECMQAGGLSMYIEPKGDIEAVVKIRWNPYPAAELNPTVEQFSVSEGVSIRGGREYAKAGAKIGIRAERIISLTRDIPGSRILAVLSTKESGVGDAEAFLPERKKRVDKPVDVRPTIVLRAHQAMRKVGVEVGGGLLADYGEVLHNAPPYSVARPNSAEFDFNSNAGGLYRLEARYAAAQSRAVDIYLNGKLVVDGGISSITGSWTNQQDHIEGVVEIKRGANTIKLFRKSVFPHISELRLVPVDRSGLLSA
ncbi:hypothetical protein GOB46_22885 [Sinorhizobium meliloti]|uniref:hypothetical protein n=1 Tax=Rhizobium meliloti TaxID=382 RepID=UPI00299EC3F1|nr:hypothetical protein [Sinorhizobium meliloti]MDW9873386.1 hypothetical protein [Sinorhizobium meliloti]MDW9885086.1 hypothetical protein [Sinorhizobium meliloti]